MNEQNEGRSAAVELERQIIGYARIGVPIVTVVSTALAGWTYGPAMGILVLAGGALVGVIAMFWSSVRTLVGETPLSGADAYALAAPRAEEERKRAVLRALKDLEFEKSVGKISEDDYQGLVSKYRAEAKRLLRLLEEDAQPKRDQVEALIAKRLRRAGLADEAGADAPAAPVAEAKSAAEKPGAAGKKARQKDAPQAKEPAEAAEEKVPAAPDRGMLCAACSTRNDPDAVFCKKCGAKQATVQADEEGEA
jgi:hypothetical protein